LSSALEESQEFTKDLIDPFVVADEVNGDPEIKTEKVETKKEKEKEKVSVPETKGYVPHPNRRFPVVPKVAGKKKWKRQKKIWILMAKKEFTHLKIPEIKST
jgi:hypothetical protein